jgi:hypothetical protein
LLVYYQNGGENMDLMEYMTVAEVAKMLNKSIPLITHLCRGGRLTNAVKLTTGAWLIPRESVLRYKPMKRGVKPGTHTKAQRLAAEREDILRQAAGTKKEESA